MQDSGAGCRMPIEEWLGLNRERAFLDPSIRRLVSPFPPPELMTNVSGLSNEREFAAQGTDLFRAVTVASGKPLTQYEAVLDFGCGCGRLTRLFKGHPHRVSGCDVDARHVAWVRENLPFIEARLSHVLPPIP